MTLAERIERQGKREVASVAAVALQAHQRAGDDMLAQLERKALPGHLLLACDDDVLEALPDKSLALGLDVIAGLLDRYVAAPDAALSLAYTIHVCQHRDVCA